MKTEVMFSSKTDNWATPQDFFDELDEEFRFTLDPCADENNHKCEKFFTKADNGLCQSWGGVMSFVILHTEKNLVSGWRKPIKKARVERVLSC